MDLFSLGGGLIATGNLLNNILSKKGTRLEKKQEAIRHLQNAINATRIYLVDNNHHYAPNYQLSELWTTAFSSMNPFNKELADMLRNKGMFWSDPQSWLNEPGAMELVPKLNELSDRLVEMNNTLNYRISRR